MSDKSYDLGKAYDKNLTAKARLHYLENERSDADSPARMYGKSKGPKMGAKKGDQSASNRDYESKGPKMESMSQEKSNLMNDNPIDNRASSPMAMKGSWMSKHTKSRM